MNIAFILTMPGNNAWNGRWSGEGRLYAKVVNVGASKKAAEKYGPLHGRSFSYDFGDGWRALVEVRNVTIAQSRDLRKRSQGFCGYDWMIEEISTLGRIRTLSERTMRATA